MGSKHDYDRARFERNMAQWARACDPRVKADDLMAEYNAKVQEVLARFGGQADTSWKERFAERARRGELGEFARGFYGTEASQPPNGRDEAAAVAAEPDPRVPDVAPDEPTPPAIDFGPDMEPWADTPDESTDLTFDDEDPFAVDFSVEPGGEEVEP